MATTLVDDAAKLLAGPRALTLEQKRRKYPVEFALKDEYERYLATKEGDPDYNASMRVMYRELRNLAEIVAVYKYGRSRRLNWEVLPHEVASSIVMTIVVRRKHVYSWTNLMKKVVRDYVANYLRSEYYDTVVTLGINDLQNDNLNAQSEGEGYFYERVESTEGFSTEDLIYFDQVLRRTAGIVYTYCSQQASLQSYLLVSWALQAVTQEKEYPFVALLPTRYRVLYDFHVERLRYLFSPLLNHTAFNNLL